MSRRAHLALQWLVAQVQTTSTKADPRTGFVVAEQHGPSRSRRSGQDRSVRLQVVDVRPADEMRTAGLATLPHDALVTLRVTIEYPTAASDLESQARLISDCVRLPLALQTAGTVLDSGTPFPVSSNVQTPAAIVAVPGPGGTQTQTVQITTILRYTEA